MMALSNVRYLRQGGEGEAGATQAPLLFLALMVAWSSQSRVTIHVCTTVRPLAHLPLIKSLSMLSHIKRGLICPHRHFGTGKEVHRSYSLVLYCR